MKVVFRNLEHRNFDVFSFLRLIRQITGCSLYEARDYASELDKKTITELQWDGVRPFHYVEELVAELNEHGDFAEIVST